MFTRYQRLQIVHIRNTGSEAEPQRGGVGRGVPVVWLGVGRCGGTVGETPNLKQFIIAMV